MKNQMNPMESILTFFADHNSIGSRADTKLSLAPNIFEDKNDKIGFFEMHHAPISYMTIEDV